MATIAFVLRGRPGLGHVTPGLAMAQALRDAGHRPVVLTYENGARFLEASPIVEWRSIAVDANFRDWPGLSLYPHGVREIMPQLESEKPDLVILGGEYFLAPIARIMSLDTAMILNPATLAKRTHSSHFKKTLAFFLEFCSLVFPTSPRQADVLARMVAGESTRVVQGPFVLSGESEVGDVSSTGLTILIANGGGCDFPATTRSYSLADTNPDIWRIETYKMTKASISTVLSSCKPEDRIFVFSCLPPADNSRIKEELRLSGQVKISPPCLDYYNVLREADVIISRVGASFLADIGMSFAMVIIWPLPGHDEHEQLVREAVEHDPGLRICRTQDSLSRSIRQVMLQLRKRRDGVERATVNQVSHAVAEIERHIWASSHRSTRDSREAPQSH